MELDSEEQKFLRDLINHVSSTSEDWREKLEGANIPFNRKFQETYSEKFGPYQREEEEIVQSLFNRDILKIKVYEQEVHQSLDENNLSKKKEVQRGLGIEKEKIDEILEKIGMEP